MRSPRPLCQRPDDGYTYDLDPRCKPGDHRVNCEVFATCTTADGAVGNIYIIWRYEDATGARTTRRHRLPDARPSWPASG